MGDFKMPSLGADMADGLLVAWRKQPGEAVHRGDIIAEVETDKGVIEVEVFEDGVVDKLLVAVNTKVPVGTPLATITSASPRAPASASASASAPAPAPAPARVPAPALATRVHATPLARTVAAALGVEVARVRGTGDGGVILRADVDRAAAGAASKPKPDRMRQAIGAAMARSKREIPHFYLAHTVDLGPALTWLAARNEARSVTDRVLPGALFVRAVARAARAVPELNAHWTGEGAPPLPNVHVGVAIALRGGGLVAPAIADADTLDVDGVMRAMADLVERARSMKLTATELTGATITVTSLGDRGVELNVPVVVPPQVAIVGFGKVVDRPWVVAGAVVPRPVVTISLAADHRATDGHRAGRFLAAVAAYLEDPEKP